MHLNRHALRAIRERSGLSITALAVSAGVSQPHLSNLESGRRQASPAVVRRLARALAVPVIALLGDPDPDLDHDPLDRGPAATTRTSDPTSSTSTTSTTSTSGEGPDPDDSGADATSILADPHPLAGLPRTGSAHPLHRSPVSASPSGGEPLPQGATMSDPQLTPVRPASVVTPIDPIERPRRGRRVAVAAVGLASAAAVLASAVPAHANTYYSGNCETHDSEGRYRTFQARGIASVDGATGRYIWNWYDYKYTVDSGLSFGSSSDEVVSFSSGYYSGLSNPWGSPDNHGTSGDWIREADWKGIWSQNGGTKIKFHAAFDIPSTPDPHCDAYIGTV